MYWYFSHRNQKAWRPNPGVDTLWTPDLPIKATLGIGFCRARSPAQPAASCLWSRLRPQRLTPRGGGLISGGSGLEFGLFFWTYNDQTSISRALKNERVLGFPRGGPGGPGVAAPSPLLCRQQERFIEKSWVHLMQLSVSTPSGRGLGARRTAAAASHARNKGARREECAPLWTVHLVSIFWKVPRSSLPVSPLPSSPHLPPSPLYSSRAPWRGAPHAIPHPHPPATQRIGVVGWPPLIRALGQRSLPASTAFPGLGLSFPTFKMLWLDTTWMPFNANGLWVKELICKICGKYVRV